MEVQTRCRHFSGYKPCHRYVPCDSHCPHRSIPSHRILIIHLEALGSVLRSTALLPAIHRKYRGAHLTWITKAPGQELLANNPLIDRVIVTDIEGLLELRALEFDTAFCIDKSRVASGILEMTKIKEILGFKVANNVIVPANEEARELWQMGLNDEIKLFHNIKSEAALIHEALNLGPYQRDGYSVQFTESERNEIYRRRSRWTKGKLLIGINTGCSKSIPFKKLTISYQRDLIRKIKALSPDYQIVLLGGHEDRFRNPKIGYGLDVIQSPTYRGLRDGLMSVATCDMVLSGDSLGMHMAIALGKWVVAWFGPTCSQEIDLFDRGVKVLSAADCSPCWKRSCNKTPMCYDLVPQEFLLRGIEKGREWLRSTCTSKPLILETSSLASPP